jgi:hypothetical protein
VNHSGYNVHTSPTFVDRPSKRNRVRSSYVTACDTYLDCNGALRTTCDSDALIFPCRASLTHHCSDCYPLSSKRTGFHSTQPFSQRPQPGSMLWGQASKSTGELARKILQKGLTMWQTKAWRVMTDRYYGRHVLSDTLPPGFSNCNVVLFGRGNKGHRDHT